MEYKFGREIKAKSLKKGNSLKKKMEEKKIRNIREEMRKRLEKKKKKS